MIISRISMDEFLQRIGSQPNGNIWSVLVISNSDSGVLVQELRETLELFTECKVGIISAVDGVSSLVNTIQEAIEDYLIIWDFENWDNSNWREFDMLRSRLFRERGGVLVLSEKSVQMMFACATNIVSWLGSRIYGFEKAAERLTDDERQTKLLALSQWSGFSDTQIIKLAESHELPSDPEYGEWLLLLGREDLIER